MFEKGDGAVSLFVSQLSRNVQASHLVEIFGAYGSVENVEIDVDKRNGVSKGNAVIYFSSHKDAENAMVYLNGGQIDGVSIVVSVSPPAEVSKAFIPTKEGKNINYREITRGSGSNEATAFQGNDRKRPAAIDIKQKEAFSGSSHSKYIPRDRAQDIIFDKVAERGLVSEMGAVSAVGSRRGGLDRGARDGRNEHGPSFQRVQAVTARTELSRADSRGRGRGRERAADRDRSHYGPAAAHDESTTRAGRGGSRGSAAAPAGGGVYGPASIGRPLRGTGYVPINRSSRTRGSPVRRSRSPGRNGRLSQYPPRRPTREAGNRGRSFDHGANRQQLRDRSISRDSRTRRRSRSRSRSDTSYSPARYRRRRSVSDSRSSRSASGSARGRRRHRYGSDSSGSSDSSVAERRGRRNSSSSRSRSRSVSRSSGRSSSSDRSRSRSHSFSPSRSPSRSSNGK